MDIGDVLAGRYELLEPAGAGGMAFVWRARDKRLGRVVAVKILRPEMAADQDLLARFEDEARHAASLAHENLASVFDAGRDGDASFIVMEWINGPSVARLLAANHRLVPGVAVGIAASVARGLAAAHERGIVHRDVKPSNILVGVDGRVCLTDFGISRAMAGARTTSTGTILGSLPYLSPEQLEGGPGAEADDLYALGVVLFEMLTGRLPWPATSPAATAVARLLQEAPRPSAEVPEVPPDLDALVGRLLALDPGLRPASAAAAAIALRSWLQAYATGRGVAGDPAGPGDPAALARSVSVPGAGPVPGAAGEEITVRMPATAQHVPPAPAARRGLTSDRHARRIPAAVAAALLGLLVLAVVIGSSTWQRIPAGVVTPAPAGTPFGGASPTPRQTGATPSEQPSRGVGDDSGKERGGAKPKPARDPKDKGGPKGKGGPKDKPRQP